jgi:leucyl aminopeptidase (aminopeptidase T)
MKDKETIKNIFTINLRVKKRERIIIFTDDKKKELMHIARIFRRIGREFAKDVGFRVFSSTGGHGIEPPEALWRDVFGKEAVERMREKGLLIPLISKDITKKELKRAEDIIREFRKDAVNAVIALPYYSTSHTRFRDLLTKVCGTRYASMPLFDELMLRGAMRVDWQGMLRRTIGIARRVKRCEEIEIKTPNGTDLRFSRAGREIKTDTGIITKAGEFSNLPAGEVFLAPLEGTAEGRLVLEWAPTRRLKSRIILIVKGGMVTSVKGSERYAAELKKRLSERPENSNIAELGIGTNDRASRLDNILESEKIFGTIHVALGDNSSFGGRVSTPFHQDFIFFRPSVNLILKDGNMKGLLKEGRLCR